MGTSDTSASERISPEKDELMYKIDDVPPWQVTEVTKRDIILHFNASGYKLANIFRLGSKCYC